MTARIRALDAAIAATAMVVPLVFTSSMRTFAAAKLVALLVGAGAALVLAAFARVPIGSWGAGAAGATLAVALIARPDVEGIVAAAPLLAMVALVPLVSARAQVWSAGFVRTIVGVPLAIGAAWSIAQCLGIGVLPASAASFGTTHAAVVGTIGNPVENTWYLLLSATLVSGVATPRAVAPAIAALGWIMLVVRARATAVVVAAALAVLGLRRATTGPRVAAALVALALAGLAVRWGLIDALAGRWFLAQLGARMVIEAGGLPRGPGSFGRDFEAAQAHALAAAPEHVGFASALDHAHFDALELAYELGMPAVLGAAWLSRAVVVALRRDPTPLRRAAAACCAIGAALGVGGYPIFSPGCATVLAIALGFALSRPSAAAPPTRTSAHLLALVIGAGLVVLGVRLARSELALTAALAAHAAGDDAAGLQLARASVEHLPTADAWATVGNHAATLGDRAAAIQAYERSLALRERAVVRRNLGRTTDR